MQTDNHIILKWKAVEFLYNFCKCPYVIMEMKVGNYIFDVIGTDGSRVFIVEAKQDLQDFRRDCNDPKVLLENINQYKQKIRETGEIKDYQKLIASERKKSIKFMDPALLKLASHRYIIAPDGMISLDEFPENWGYLSDGFKMIKECKGNSIERKYADKIIKEISKRYTQYYLETQGVSFGKQIIFPVREICK